MSSEAQMVFEIWDAVRDFVPVSKRLDVAETIVKAMSEYGFEAADLAEIVDEDDDLAEAYQVVFSDRDYDDEIEEEE
jgi:hypothetical protein